jgi:hypothetical protein
MTILVNVGLAMIGFLVGNMLFAKVGESIVTIHGIAKDDEGSKAPRIAFAALLSAGPWFLVASGRFAFYVHSKPWAIWIFVGKACAIVFFSAFSLYLARKAAKSEQGA